MVAVAGSCEVDAVRRIVFAAAKTLKSLRDDARAATTGTRDRWAALRDRCARALRDDE